jgi:hypothetical protein
MLLKTQDLELMETFVDAVMIHREEIGITMLGNYEDWLGEVKLDVYGNYSNLFKEIGRPGIQGHSWTIEPNTLGFWGNIYEYAMKENIAFNIKRDGQFIAGVSVFTMGQFGMITVKGPGKAPNCNFDRYSMRVDDYIQIVPTQSILSREDLLYYFLLRNVKETSWDADVKETMNRISGKVNEFKKHLKPQLSLEQQARETVRKNKGEKPYPFDLLLFKDSRTSKPP